jgi:hypothetical protein
MRLFLQNLNDEDWQARVAADRVFVQAQSKQWVQKILCREADMSIVMTSSRLFKS